MLRFLWVKMSVSLPFQWFQIEFKKSVFVCSRIPRGFAMVRILLCIIQLYYMALSHEDWELQNSRI